MKVDCTKTSPKRVYRRPIASVLITTYSIADVPMSQLMRVNIYFVLVLAVVLLLVTIFPALSPWLPANLTNPS